MKRRGLDFSQHRSSVSCRVPRTSQTKVVVLVAGWGGRKRAQQHEHYPLALGPLSPKAGCDGDSKDLVEEKVGLGAGWDVLKKASSRNTTH